MNKKDKLLKRFYSLPKDLSMTKMAIATSCISLILQI